MAPVQINIRGVYVTMRSKPIWLKCVIGGLIHIFISLLENGKGCIFMIWHKRLIKAIGLLLSISIVLYGLVFFLYCVLESQGKSILYF